MEESGKKKEQDRTKKGGHNGLANPLHNKTWGKTESQIDRTDGLT